MENELQNELRNLYEDYKILYSDFEKLKKENEFLRERENKLQNIEFVFNQKEVDLHRLSQVIMEEI